MIRFKYFYTEYTLSEGKLSPDKIKQACDMLSNPGNDDADIIKAVGAKYLAAAKRAKGIKEADEGGDMGQKLGPAEIKAINAELFTAARESKGNSDLKSLFDPIRQVMTDHGIEITFGTRLISGKGQKEFSCDPYTNVKLVVSWSESKGEFLLKDVSLQGVQ